VFFDDKRGVAELGKIILGWKKESHMWEHERNVHWYDILIALFLRLFASVL
jgi:hypothetical protein